MKLHRGDPPPGWEPVPGYKGFIRPKKSNGSDSDMSVENSVLAALLKNIKGDTGPVGPSGRDGRDGIDGKDGRDGKDGNPGPMGPRGEKGDKGDTGPRGPAGKNGKDGKDGKDGVDGKDGKDGISFKDLNIHGQDMIIKTSDGKEKRYKLPTGGGSTPFGGGGTTLPDLTNNSGKYLTNDGTTLSWSSVDALPSQTGNNGKYLTTNGTAASWATVEALPSQTGNSGKYLTTNGTAASWATLTVGTLAAQDANNVAITGGSITGITDLAIADGGTGASNAADARTNLGLGTVATLASDTDGTLASNSDTRVATQKAVKTYVDNSVTGLLDFKGSTDCSTNPNYPAASKGDAYVVSVAGKIGGASGIAVDIGDVYVASADNPGGTQAAVGASWFILEHNLQGALLSANNLSDLASASSARTNLLPTYSGNGGKALALNSGATDVEWKSFVSAPSGSDTQVQFNDNGSFAGDSTLTFNKTTKTFGANSLSLSGNISASAWTTNGIRYKNVSATLTDTSSSGTVAAAYTNVFGGNTIAATNSTTFTDYATTYIAGPMAGANVTFTNGWSLICAQNIKAPKITLTDANAWADAASSADVIIANQVFG